jgi:ABC-type dipeptide/oligopeptide/nickel transport system permease subunit
MLPVNEITLLMGVIAVGIITIIGIFLYVVADAFFGKRN